MNRPGQDSGTGGNVVKDGQSSVPTTPAAASGLSIPASTGPKVRKARRSLPTFPGAGGATPPVRRPTRTPPPAEPDFATPEREAGVTTLRKPSPLGGSPSTPAAGSRASSATPSATPASVKPRRRLPSSLRWAVRSANRHAVSSKIGVKTPEAPLDFAKIATQRAELPSQVDGNRSFQVAAAANSLGYYLKTREEGFIDHSLREFNEKMMKDCQMVFVKNIFTRIKSGDIMPVGKVFISRNGSEFDDIQIKLGFFDEERNVRYVLVSLKPEFYLGSQIVDVSFQALFSKGLVNEDAQAFIEKFVRRPIMAEVQCSGVIPKGGVVTKYLDLDSPQQEDGLKGASDKAAKYDPAKNKEMRIVSGKVSSFRKVGFDGYKAMGGEYVALDAMKTSLFSIDNFVRGVGSEPGYAKFIDDNKLLFSDKRVGEIVEDPTGILNKENGSELFFKSLLVRVFNVANLLKIDLVDLDGFGNYGHIVGDKEVDIKLSDYFKVRIAENLLNVFNFEDEVLQGEKSAIIERLIDSSRKGDDAVRACVEEYQKGVDKGSLSVDLEALSSDDVPAIPVVKIIGAIRDFLEPYKKKDSLYSAFYADFWKFMVVIESGLNKKRCGDIGYDGPIESFEIEKEDSTARAAILERSNTQSVRLLRARVASGREQEVKEKDVNIADLSLDKRAWLLYDAIKGPGVKKKREEDDTLPRDMAKVLSAMCAEQKTYSASFNETSPSVVGALKSADTFARGSFDSPLSTKAIEKKTRLMVAPRALPPVRRASSKGRKSSEPTVEEVATPRAATSVSAKKGGPPEVKTPGLTRAANSVAAGDQPPAKTGTKTRTARIMPMLPGSRGASASKTTHSPLARASDDVDVSAQRQMEAERELMRGLAESVNKKGDPSPAVVAQPSGSAVSRSGNKTPTQKIAVKESAWL